MSRFDYPDCRGSCQQSETNPLFAPPGLQAIVLGTPKSCGYNGPEFGQASTEDYMESLRNLQSRLFLALFLAVAGCGGSGSDAGPEMPSLDALSDSQTPNDLLGDQGETLDPDAADVTLTDVSEADANPDPCLGIPSPCGRGGLVDPLIGSGEFGYKLGAVFVGALAPFGMVKVGPDTSHDTEGRAELFHCSGYFHPDNHIDGFSHTHFHGTGAVDYGDILVMAVPEMTPSTTTWDGYRSLFSHDNEVSRAGYYAVTLENGNIRAEMTASTRAAIHRYSFPEGEQGTVLVDASYTLDGCSCDNVEIRIDPEKQIVQGRKKARGGLSGRHDGYDIWFYGQFNRPFSSHGTFAPGELLPDATERADTTGGAYFVFDVSKDRQVELRLAISFNDQEGARKNFEAEVEDRSFEDVYRETLAAWEGFLSAVEVSFESDKDEVIFYTALYHTAQMPTIYQDVDDRYRGFDKEVHELDYDGDYYTDFSLWDTFRNTHPLYVLLYPERQADMLRSLVKMLEQGGYLPKWAQGIGYTNCMVGTSADMVVADSVLKGLTDFDVEAAYESMLWVASNPTDPASGYSGRRGVTEYVALGYVPSDVQSGSVSRTQEFVYADYCIFRLAETLGDSENAALFQERAGWYRNLWEPESAFFRARSSDSTFDPYFKELTLMDAYVEGNAWQYLWYVPHDIQGLKDLMGGWGPFVERLDFFFSQSVATWVEPFPSIYYFHGNEPDIHAAFQYSFAGEPDKASQWVKWIKESGYNTSPTGLLGNDDAGTLSAWYVFAALGFYPIPCTNQYALVAPGVVEATVHLGEGKLVVRSSGEGERLGAIRLGETSLDRAYVMHSELMQAETLDFEFSQSGRSWSPVEE